MNHPHARRSRNAGEATQVTKGARRGVLRPLLANEVEPLRERPEHAGDLGERLRGVRLAMGLTLKEVAARSGLSRAFLSQVERNRVSPSVASLTRIAKALDLSLSGLFAPRADGEGLVRSGRRARITYGTNRYVDELLSPSLSGHLLALLSTIQPGANSGDEPYAHDADEECIFVIEGSLEVTVEDETYKLRTGDALTFVSRRGHGWRNSGTKRAVVVWVITPPRY